MLDIGRTVARAKEAGRVVFVNVDLIDGFSGRDVVVDWLVENTPLDGILSTKSSMIRAARRRCRGCDLLQSGSLGDVG